MKSLVLLAALTLPLLSQAAPAVLPTVSGDTLVLRFFGEPSKRNATPTIDMHVDREKARSYVDGIRDLTEGERWCNSPTTKADEMHIEVIAAISRLNAERRKSNAALLVVEALAKLYPCKQNRSNQRSRVSPQFKNTI